MFPVQVILALITAIVLYHPQFLGLHEVGVPTVKEVVDVGIWYVPVATIREVMTTIVIEELEIAPREAEPAATVRWLHAAKP